MAQQERQTRKNPDGTYSIFFQGQWKRVPREYEGRLGLTPQDSPEQEIPETEGIIPHLQSGLISGVTLGIDPAEEAVLSGYKKLGGAVAEGDPRTWKESAARVAGETVGSILPITAATTGFLGGGWIPASFGGAAALARSSPRIVGTLRQLMNPYVTSPATTAFAETAAGAGAGVGRYETRGTPYESVGEMLGAFAGGAGATSLPVRGLMKAPRAVLRGVQAVTASGRARLRQQAQEAARQSERSIRSTLETHPMSPGSSGISPAGDVLPRSLTGQRATWNIRRRLEDPALVSQRMKEEALSQFTTLAQQTGDPTILANAEFLIAREGPEAIRKYRVRVQRAIDDLGGQGSRVGRGASLGASLEPGPLPDTLIRLQDDLQSHATRLGRDIPRTNIATQAATDLESAYVNARKEQNRLWAEAESANPARAKIPTADVEAEWRNIINTVPKAQQKDIPSVVKELLPEKGVIERSNDVLQIGEAPFELQAIYSRLREVAREAPRRSNESRLAGKFAEAVDLALAGIPEFETARNYTRTMHDAFDRNRHIWSLFESAGVGGGETSIVRNPTAIMEMLNPVGGTSTSANVARDLLDASSFGGPEIRRNNTQTVEALSDYLRQKFLEAARNTTSGEDLVNIKNAETFMRRNRDLWDAQRFPELKSVATELAQTLERVQRYKSLSTLNTEMGQIFTHQRPLLRFRSAIKLGPEGAAKWTQPENRGLLKDAIFDQATRVPQGTENAGSFLPDAGNRLNDYLRRPGTRAVFEEVYTKPELERMGLLADEWKNVERSLGSRGQEGVTTPGGELIQDNVIGRLIKSMRYFSRVKGAEAGQMVSGQGMGSSLQTAARTATEAEKGLAGYLDKAVLDLLSRGYRDKEVFTQLLANADTLDAPAWRRLLGMASGFTGDMLINRIQRLAFPVGMAAAKAQVPTEEEKQEAVRWFQENPASAFDRQITSPPQPPSGPRIGPPRR
jgi:hypothetical protein